MTQTLTVGTLMLDADASWFTIRRIGIKGATGRINRIRVEWTINGRTNTTADPGSPNSAQSAALEPKVIKTQAAFKDGCDLIFSLGSNMRLMSGDCTEGTHVQLFEWTNGTDGVRGSGLEGVARRTFRAIVYGDILVASDTDIIQWQESLTWFGTGLAKTLPAVSLNGTVQAQQVARFTPFYCIQSGFAVGLTNYPSPPTATFQGIPGFYFLPDGVSTTKMTPRRWGVNTNSEFPVRWSYKCWSSIQNNSPLPRSF